MAETVVESQGAEAGAQETPAAAGSEINLDELVASLDKKPEPTEAPAQLDEESVKRLESLDPAALPEGLRRKLEAPFLSRFTTKTTEWDQERQRLLGLVERLSNQSRAATPEATVDEKELLRQKIAEGDLSAIEQLVDQRFEAKYGKDMENIKLDSAYRTAVQLFPESNTMVNEIADTLKSNPGIAWVVKSVAPKDPTLAGTLLAGVAKNLAYDKAAAELKSLKESLPKLKKDAIEEYQRRIGKLPSSTFKGGSTPTGGSAEQPKSLRDALEAAWQEQVRG